MKKSRVISLLDDYLFNYAIEDTAPTGDVLVEFLERIGIITIDTWESDSSTNEPEVS